MKRVLLVIVAALIVFAGVLVTAPNFIDWSKHKQNIFAKLEEATGYQYAVGGDLDIVLLPYPRFMVEQLAVSVPPASEPFVTLERAEIALELWPLLQGKAEVSSISLVKPKILAVIKADGTPGWMTPVLKQKMENKNAKQAGETSLADAVSLNEIKIKDGLIRYADKRSKKSYELQSINIALRGDTLFGPYSADGSLSYADQQIDITAKTGRIDEGGKNIALQTTIKVPSSSSVITYSGVLALQGQAEIQGETGISTDNLAGLVALAGGKNEPSAMLEKPLTAKGVLTASAVGIAYRNLHINFAGVEANGSAIVTMPKGEKPMVADIKLEAIKAINMASLMPAAVAKKKKANKSFLPESITLPNNLDTKIDIMAPSISYKGTKLDNTKLQIDKSGKITGIKLVGTLPDDGQLNLESSLVFASSSQAQATGVVTLSDPVLSYNIAVKSGKASSLLQGFVPERVQKTALSSLSGPLAFSAEGSVKPQSVSIKSGALSILQTKIALSSSYIVGRNDKRDMLKLSLGATQTDFDRWSKAFQGGGETSAEPFTVKKAVQKLLLPFDLQLSAKLGDITFKEKNYQSFELLTALSGVALDIKTAALTDSAGNNLLFKGTVGNLESLNDMDLIIQGKTPNMPAILEGVGKGNIKLPSSLKRAEILAELKGNADKLVFTSNMQAMRGTLDASGTLSNVLKVPEVSGLTVRIQHPNYVEMARLYNPQFNSGVGIKKNLDIFASMERVGSSYNLKELQATIGPSTITGSLKTDMTPGQKPSIKAELQAGDLPLDKLMGHDASHKGSTRVRPSNQKDVRWSRNAINTGWMHQIDLALKATASSLSYGPWDLSNADIDLVLADGTATINKISGGLHGGKIDLSGRASSSPNPREPLSVEAKINLEKVSLESFVSSFSGSKLLDAKGVFSLNTDITTTGLSPAALIFDLQGKGTANGENLLFEGFDLARLSRTLAQPSSSLTENLTSLLNTTMAGGTTAFEALTSSYDIEQGVIKFSDLTLKGPSATVSSLGNVSLPLWTIDMESSIKLAEPADAPPLKAVFKGPLDRPGQTFAKSALDGYVQNLLGNQVQDLIKDKLNTEGVLDKFLPQQQTQPAPTPAPVQNESNIQQPTQQQQAPQQPAQDQQKPITPEDAFMGILQGVIQGQ